jgi:hypothetical protein
MSVFRPRAPIWSNPPTAAEQAPCAPRPAVVSTVAAVAFGLGMGSAYAASARPVAVAPTPAVTRPCVAQTEAPQPFGGICLRAAVGGPYVAPTYTDTFTDTTGTALASHTPDMGGSWTQHSSYAGTLVISDANRVRCSSGNALYYYSDSPASPDYDVSIQINDLGGTTQVIGPAGRIDTAANTFYRAHYDPSTVQLSLVKVVAGSTTSLGTQSISGTTFRLTLSLRGESLYVYQDSTLRISKVDSSISAAGRMGIFASQSSANGSGVHGDDFSAGTALARTEPAGVVLARSEPPQPHPGWVFAYACEAPQPVTATPARPLLVSADSPRPYPGWVFAPEALPPAIPRTTVPAIVEIVSAEPPRPYPGWAFSQVNTTPPPLFGAPPRPLTARAEEPRPEAGRAWAPFVLPPQAALPHGAGVAMARQEPPQPYAGRVVSAIGPAPEPPPSTPAEEYLISAEAPRPYPGAVILSSVRYTVTANPATPRKSFIISAERPRPEDGRVYGAPDTLRKRPPRDTLSGLLYRVYRNDGRGGPIDYSTIVASTPGLTWTSSALVYPGVHKFGVRAYDQTSSLEERNVDAVIVLKLDGSGVDITSMPDPPTNLSGILKASGSVRLDWSYQLTDPLKLPTGFRVYYGLANPPISRSVAAQRGRPIDQRIGNRTVPGPDLGTAQPIIRSGGISVDLGTIRATVAYSRGVAFYTTTFSGLTDARSYTFVVRAYNASGEETNLLTTTLNADSTGPPNPYSLSGTTTS